MSADRSASVLARLLNRSRNTGENYNLLLSRFVIERLLYRLSVSPHAGSFVLKGALLFALWYDTPHRPTKDADLLGFGADDADTLRATFTSVCAIDADDGVRYDIDSMRIAPIREDNVYGGLRMTLTAFVGSARLPVQVDIGFGDAITPSPELVYGVENVWHVVIGAQMSSTIRIKRSGQGRLFFEVHAEGAIPVLTSAHYSTICKMERGLALLFAAAHSSSALLIEPDEDAMKIGLKNKRGRVTFVGQLSESMVQSAMSTIASAQVIDDRPSEQRRTDLSGRLCDLHH